MFNYTFRVAYEQDQLDLDKPFAEREDAGIVPRLYIRCALAADNLDAECNGSVQYWGDALSIENFKFWFNDNRNFMPPEYGDADHATPRQFYSVLASTAGRRAWAWELETDDDGADFEHRPPLPTRDADGIEIVY